MESEKNNRKQIYQQAEEEVLKEHERSTVRRLANAAWRSLGYDEPLGVRQSEVVSSGREKVMEQDPLNISLSDLFEKDELFGDALEEVKGEEEKEISRVGEVMRKYMLQELLHQGREYHRLSKEQNEIDFAYRVLNKKDYEGNRALDMKSREIRSEIEQIGQSTPEGYYVVHGSELRLHIREIKDGGIATTPYVKENLSAVEHNMDEGQPTFIHGHLGSGKTELAIMAAKQSAIKRAAYKEAVVDFREFKQNKPDLSPREYREYASDAYRKNIVRFEKALRDGDSDEFSPLVISGSKDLTTQDLFADKTLKLTKFNGKTILEHKKDVDAEFEKWKMENPTDAMDPDKAMEASRAILELFKMKNQAFGTEVGVIENAVYRGVKEGRPVVIDEVNAIPATILISMNDILQRRPGDDCYIPGVGKTKIQPGFSITMTGNLSSSLVNYHGTDYLNPAFLSRLDVIEHDYLPMSETDRGYKEQADPKANELFQAIIYSLADRQGNLRLPEIDESMEKIFALTQLAHETQRIFGGKWQESVASKLQTASGDEMEPRLEESVLSIRNILRVVGRWEKGRKGDLDKALWDGYVSGITNSDEQNFTLALAKRYGFFQESDGWKVTIKERGAGATSFSEIHPERYEYTPKELETWSYRKVIEALYGSAPERETYPDDLDLEELADLGNDEIELDDVDRIEAKLKEFSDAISALEVLGEQCGCNVATTQ